MGSFMKGFKKGTKAFKDSFGPGRYSVAGTAVVCPHCQHDVFAEGEAQLNTAGMTFLNLDWLNQSAKTLVCTHCGYIMWFAKGVEREN